MRVTLLNVMDASISNSEIDDKTGRVTVDADEEEHVLHHLQMRPQVKGEFVPKGSSFFADYFWGG